MRRSTAVSVGVLLALVAEVALLVWLAGVVGVGWTVVILLALAALGGFLLRHEGARAWASLRTAGSDPEGVGERLSDAAVILVAGILLVIPGLISDVLAVVCLIPATRPLARRGIQAVLNAATRRYRDQADLLDAKLHPETVVEPDTTSPAPGDDPTVIRGEIIP